MFCFLKNLTTTKILNFEFYTLFGTVSKVSNFPIPQTSDNQAKKDIIQKDPDKMSGSFVRGWRLPTFPHLCSIIGAGGLNFSVRNG